MRARFLFELLLLLLLVVGAVPQVSAREPICPSTTGNSWEHGRCEEARLIAGRTGLARREAGRLTLTLDDGRRIDVLDRPSAREGDLEVASHALVGVLDAPRLFVVMTTLYEGGALTLFSRASGRRWEVGGSSAVPSPSGARVATWGPWSGHDDSALEIWRLDGDLLVLEFKGETGEWWPESIRWIDGSTLEFERASGSPGAPEQKGLHRLERDETASVARWRSRPLR
jgi:hypothetical protein